MVLALDAATGRLYTVASSGYATSGVGSEIEVGDGVIGVAARERTPVRIMHMTNAYLYSHAIRRSLPPDTSRDIYRIRLTGETAEPLTLAPLERALSGEFFRLELRDDTRLRRDLWDRCGDDTLRGLFLGQLRREYDGADPQRQKEIEQAVRFGLAAMDNTIDS